MQNSPLFAKSQLNRQEIDAINDLFTRGSRRKFDYDSVRQILRQTKIDTLFELWLANETFNESFLKNCLRKATIQRFVSNSLVFQTFEENTNLYFVLSGSLGFYLQNTSVYADRQREKLKIFMKEASIENNFSEFLKTNEKEEDDSSEEEAGKSFGSSLRLQSQNSAKIENDPVNAVQRGLLAISLASKSNFGMKRKHQRNAYNPQSSFFLIKPSNHAPKKAIVPKQSADPAAHCMTSSLRIAVQEHLKTKRNQVLIKMIYILSKIKINCARLLRNIRAKIGECLAFKLVTKDQEAIVENIAQFESMLIKVVKSNEFVVNPALFERHSTEYAAVALEPLEMLVIKNDQLTVAFVKREKIERESLLKTLKNQLGLNLDFLKPSEVARFLTECEVNLTAG